MPPATLLAAGTFANATAPGAAIMSPTRCRKDNPGLVLRGADDQRGSGSSGGNGCASTWTAKLPLARSPCTLTATRF
jgi:hypothetical protein